MEARAIPARAPVRSSSGLGSASWGRDVDAGLSSPDGPAAPLLAALPALLSMARVDVVMPKMGESVMEGTVLEWKKTVGDTIEQDETLLEISTDKVDSEVPSPEAGTLLEILVEEGDTVDVGTPIAIIGAAGAVAEAPASPSGDGASAPEPYEKSYSAEVGDTASGFASSVFPRPGSSRSVGAMR